MSDIAQSRRFVLGSDLTNAADRSFNVSFHIPFIPEAVVVESVSYSGDAAITGNTYQIWSNLSDDGVLAVFDDVAQTTNPNNFIDLRSRPSSSGTYNFQVQDLPAFGSTGSGVVSTTATGELMFILNFVRYYR